MDHGHEEGSTARSEDSAQVGHTEKRKKRIRYFSDGLSTQGKKKKRECEIWSVGHLFANTTGGRLVWLVLCNYCKKKEKNSMNCVYFAVWAQNQLRSGNNKQPCHQPYSSQHLFCCPDNAPLYATWRPGGWAVGTPANSALGSVTRGFSGHSIRDSWCHGHIRCLAPHTMAIENARAGTQCRTPVQSVRSPQENGTDVSLGGERPRPREGRLCSGPGQFLCREDVWASFCCSIG